ncbi:hypothetical protein MW887_008410 [Aspergillus wentii]|nr:hypothetical protein MW887_008410 [Aspergillus wentii]
MFSEYASRFLAQSQSRILYRHDETRQNNGRGRLMRQQGNSRLPSRVFLQQTADPYQPAASQTYNFPFASRASVQPAPLFYSATDEFHEDDEAEHEREIADFYALQRSRRHFGSSHLKDSSEIDEDEDDENSVGTDDQQVPPDDRFSKGKGIRSSWYGGKGSRGLRNIHVEPVPETLEHEHESRTSQSCSRVQENLVDIGLDDTLRTDVEDTRKAGSSGIKDERPPSVQLFREQPQTRKGQIGIDSFLAPVESVEQAGKTRPPSSAGSYPRSVEPILMESPAHDAFWGQLFLISLACLLATAILVYLHTSAPSGDKSKWGDTIYMTVHKSFYLLSAYTLLSAFVSLLWLALLRSYVRSLVYVMVFTVPVLLYSFSLYPFISSFKGAWHGASIQDKIMRCGSAVPFIMASLWIYNVIRGRHAIGKAVSILEFACRILAANPELLVLALAILICIVSWTWAWMLMFTRVFLAGRLSGSSSFVIDFSTWWLGVYFIMVYLWSLGVITGIQRAVTAATSHQSSAPLASYRLSKLILHAVRFMMSLALGFGGWVTTARNLVTPGAGGPIRGSVYAYVVGLMAGAIGWSVLGAMEGVVADIVDASVVCWSSEVGTYGKEAKYCREAGWLFSDDSGGEFRYTGSRDDQDEV